MLFLPVVPRYGNGHDCHPFSPSPGRPGTPGSLAVHPVDEEEEGGEGGEHRGGQYLQIVHPCPASALVPLCMNTK